MIQAVATAAGAEGSSPTAQREQIKQAAQQFEAIFLRQLLSAMRSAKLTDDDLFGSDAGDQFRDLADARTAESMSQQGAFGIAEMLLGQFLGRPNTNVAGATAAVDPSGQAQR